MAYYAALLSAIELLEDILNPNRYPNSLSVKTTTVMSLHHQFTRLLDSLQDFSSISHPAAADCLQTQIRDAAYRTLDIIDHLTIKDESKALKGQHAFNKLFRFVSEWKLQKVGREVHSIIQELNVMKGNRSGEHVSLDYYAAAASEQEQPWICTGDTNTMVGFGEHLAAIKDQLFGSAPQLQVISIVGMAGIGKTTLARNLFEDVLILREFDYRVWVTISQDYNVARVLLQIVKSLGMMRQLGEALAEMDEREREITLKNHVYKYLKGRKFLIVIDDVWNTLVWDDIKHMFPNEPMRSRIVLTTRLVDVAEYATSDNYIHQMQLLNMDESWTLLQEKSFAQGCCPPELVDVGKCIASKCSGLPLAIVIIGGTLSNDKNLRSWENVAVNVGSFLNKPDAHLSNVMSLSYNHLPHQLKPCFLHMGSFPEDYEINISKLVKLWIAEGFLKLDTSSKSLEQVGDEYVEDLVKRNLVIITKKRVNGNNKSCVMHDLTRDFCRQRGLHEQFFRTSYKKRWLQRNGAEKVRRIALDSGTLLPWANDNGKHVRSICLFSKEIVSVNVDSLKLDNVNLLRMLDVADLRNQIAPCVFSGKFHLKYLALKLSDEGIFRLGLILFEFKNLETLILSNPKDDLFYVSKIWEMLSLKYLIADGMLFPSIPRDLHHNKLEHLHTLETAVDLVFTLEVTQMISNVRKLKVQCFSILRSAGDLNIWNLFCLNNLVNLLQLEKLNITFHGYVLDTNSLCRSFVFPQNLVNLSLIGCQLPWEALSVMGIGSLKCLQVLKLGYNAMVGQVWDRRGIY